MRFMRTQPALPTRSAYQKIPADELPPRMEEFCLRGPFRVPLAQFIMDWNHSENPVFLIENEPVYTGPNDLILPAISVIVHSLCARDGIKIPDWVLKHKSTNDLMLFGVDFDSKLGQLIRKDAPPACKYHRVWFESQLLDKGTARQWTA